MSWGCIKYSLHRPSDVTIPHLTVAICGKRIDEPLVMLKSVVLFAKSSLVIHIITDSSYLEERVKTEDVLSDVDSVFYVDADTLFLAPVNEIWSHLHHTFNSSQFIAAMPESDNLTGSYIRRGTIPYYRPSGINAGVLLMNLTRLRRSSWSESITKTLIEYGKKAKFADQDLINVYMHNHPEHSVLLTCDWNFRQHQCKQCDQADKTGVSLLHGVTVSFRNDNILPFKAVYSAFKEFILGKHSVEHDLIPSIERNLHNVKSKDSFIQFAKLCNSKPDVFTKRIKDFIRDK